MSDTILRLRAICDRHFNVIVVSLVILVALGGSVTYDARVDPTFESEQRVVTAGTTTGEFTHRAVVTENNSVFELGTTLENRPAYFVRVAPILEGAFTYSYDAPSADNVSVEMDVVQVLRAVDEETVYWSEETRLERVTAHDVSPQVPVEANFTINTSGVNERIDTIQTELGSSPGEPEVVVRVSILLTGTVDEEPTEYRETAQLQLMLSGSVYAVEVPETPGSAINRTESVLVQRGSGPLRSIGAPLLFGTSLAGLFVIGLGWYRGRLELTDAEREYLRYRDDRSEFDDWISRIDLPEEAFDRPTAQAETLGDLADYAIDSDTTVVEDPDGTQYYVVGEKYLYRYSAPSVDRESIL